MIKLFISDIDGCISVPFEAPDWNEISKLRALNQESESDDQVPPLTICSGRPYPYVEAIAQFLDVRLPVVFESAGIFNLQNHQISTNSVFDEETERQTGQLKLWLEKEIIPHEKGMVPEFTKRMDAGLVHPHKSVIQKVYPRIKEYVQENFPDFQVHYTDVSINIVVKENNKATGIRDLCLHLNLEPKEVAFIGDSSGDIPGLKISGKAFAPINAADEVKKVAEVIPFESTKAVVTAYKKIIEENRTSLQKTA